MEVQYNQNNLSRKPVEYIKMKAHKHDNDCDYY